MKINVPLSEFEIKINTLVLCYDFFLNKKSGQIMGKVTPYQGSAPENGSGNRPEFPTKKPDNLPQLKYDGLYRKYCRILQSTAFRQGKNTKKKEAKRNKQLNVVIEMVIMSNNDSLALRQENNVDEDNLLKGIDI